MKLSHNLDYFSKYPTDKFDIEFDFTKDLPSSDTLASCTATIFDSFGIDKTASMISGTTASTPDCTFTIDAGTSGETYSIKLVGITAAAKKYTHYIKCEVFGSTSLNTKLGDSTANSYVTLKEANDYIRNKYGHDSIWDTLSVEGKNRVLVEAANMMNTFNFTGDRYYDSQSLAFPLSDHAIVTGNCGTPITTTSFRHTNLKSTTYGKYPTNFWKYGTIHITSATPVYDIRNVSKSHVTTGSITVDTAFSAAPTTNSGFTIFVPLFDEVKDAQIEQALFIVENTNIETLNEYRSAGAKEIEIGDTRVAFSDSAENHKIMLAPNVRKMLSRWIRKTLRIGRG